jgi:hypothetical protein
LVWIWKESVFRNRAGSGSGSVFSEYGSETLLVSNEKLDLPRTLERDPGRLEEQGIEKSDAVGQAQVPKEQPSEARHSSMQRNLKCNKFYF